MKPMARLKIALIRTYEKNCDEPKPEEEASACETSSWGDWSECSVKCGEGKKRKQRVYIDPAKALNMGCLKTLLEIENCIGDDPHCHSQRQGGGFGSFGSSKKSYNQMAECALTEWTPWGKCSSNCGRGFKIRSRSYRVQSAQARCEGGVTNQPKLYEREDCADFTGCMGEVNPIGTNAKHDASNCATTNWSEWSACSVTCGYGMKIRTRHLQRRTFSSKHSDDCSHVELQDEIMCGQNNPPCNTSSYDGVQNQIPHYCMMPPDAGTCRDFTNKWFYDPTKNDCGIFSYSQCGGNDNRFDSLTLCLEKCRNPNFVQGMNMGISHNAG